MGLEEIERLKARLEKDPNSKCFLPLAEEYRKEKMYDEAIEVLKEGLDKYPQYTSARVVLGKIYYEKGDTEKAKEVFEEVIKRVPDNLFVHRKLADIYFNEGNLDKALEYYEKVLALNPFDEEVQSLIEALKGESKKEHKGEGVESETPVEEEAYEVEGLSEEASEEVVGVGLEEGVEEEPEVMAGFEEETWVEEEPVEEIPVFNLNAQLEEETDEQEDAFNQYSEFSSFAGEQVFEGPDSFELTSEEEEEVDLFEEEVSTEGPSEEVASGEDIEELIVQADRAVKEERFFDAIQLYKKALQMDPDNRMAKQRMEEFRLLLKLSGKDQEVLIEELERFKEALKSRANEFSGNP